MVPDGRSLYLSIHEYIHNLVRDRDISLRLTNVFIRADVPLQTFITAAKLYGLILSRASLESERKYSECKYSRDNFTHEKSKYIGKMSSKIIKNPYQTFISCCVISSKFHKDIAFNNESWGGISFLSKNEINEYERIALSILDYKISSAGDGHVMSEVQSLLRRSGYEIPSVNQKPFDFRYLMRKLFCFN